MQKKSEGKVTISNGDLWLCLPMPFFLHLEGKSAEDSSPRKGVLFLSK